MSESIEEWDVDKLDELGAWAALVDGCELVDADECDITTTKAPHGINYPHEMHEDGAV